jgi:hypothetical protein
VTPSSGYDIASITINGQSQSITTQFTLSNITANQTVVVTFTQTSQQPPTLPPPPPPVSGTIIGTSNGLSIPADHPRLWFNPARLAQARTYYQTHPYTPSSSDWVGQAYRYLMTGETNYCTTAINGIMALTLTDGAANSVNGGVASDGVRTSAQLAAGSTTGVIQSMTQTQKDTLLTRWTTYVNNVRQNTLWGQPDKVDSNYNWGYLRAMVEWGIAGYGDSSSG